MTGVFSAGSVIDQRYEILRLLSKGGMGEVYCARRILLGDEVAIKVIHPDWELDEKLRERFMRESRTCALLRHPNIVAILDFNIAPEGRPYLVMEYLNGPSLKEELSTTGPFSPEKARDLLLPLCGALQMAHERRIFHRDLKPANILSQRYGSEVVYKIIDFGLAAIRGSSNVQVTQPGQFFGSLAYASPEQLQGEDLDCRTDIYSLGIILFEMLAGRLPFEGPTPIALLAQHLREEPPELSNYRSGLPPRIEDVVRKALAKSPSGRWASAAEFGRALSAACEPGAGSAKQSRTGSGFLDKYELGPAMTAGRLGSRIFQGTHRALGVPVAIRILRRENRENWEAVRSRFLTEARAAQVPHPSVMQVRDFGEENDLVYVVTDLVPGCSLREYMERHSPMRLAVFSGFLLQVLDGASAVHRRGALLCGLCPEIIRVTPEENTDRVIISSGGITQAQDLLSTISDATLRGRELADRELCYIAPELLMGSPADPRADIYSIGVLAYEMATGALPFAGRTLPQLLGAALQGRPRDPRELRPDLQEAAALCILKSLARDPGQRYSSASEMRAAWPDDRRAGP
jgi:serine/threonine-protein kinase